MRRFLLAFLFLFSLNYSYSQVILNELYTSPKTGLSEFFELYNTKTGSQVNLDCYAMIVYYDDGAGKRGFYVLDFPNLNIGPLSYFTGAAIGPDFGIQQCAKTRPNFNWKSVNGTSDASLINYELSGTTYVEKPFPDPEDFLTSNKNATTGGFNYAVFLFNDGKYVNGFLGGHNTNIVPSSVTGMPPLEYSTNCGGSKTVNWSTITRAENVTENTGTDKNADNGYMRQRDGKCGEWVKASSPSFDPNTGKCSTNKGEHTPGTTNNGEGNNNVNDGFSITTQTSVCGTRIDFAITDVKDKGNLKAPDMFPFVVELYEDVNKNGVLDGEDLYIATSAPITGVSNNYFQFPNLTSTSQYLLVFKSQNLNCLEKIVATSSQTLTTTEANYCGSQIDVTVNQANFNVGSGFTVSIYEDQGIIGQYEPALDLPFTDPALTPYQYTGGQIGQTRTFDIPTQHEGKPYIIVYSSGACVSVTRSGLTPVTTTITPTQIYVCGDFIQGNPLTFKVESISGNTSGATPMKVEVWLDINGNGVIEPTGSTPDILYETKTNVAVGTTYQTWVYEDSKIPLIIRYITGRGCDVRLMAIPECSPLPVHLSNFTAVRKVQKVLLKWETLTEQNSRGFYVQRNTNGVWENRAFVFSAADGGNSTKPLEYSFNDDNAQKGVSQYRIQQVDLDSRATYSPIRSVKGIGQLSRIIIYPNPSEDGKVNVVFEDQGAKNVIISDINGRIVQQFHNVINNLAVDKLGVGMYLIQITDLSTAETSVEKVIIKKR